MTKNPPLDSAQAQFARELEIHTAEAERRSEYLKQQLAGDRISPLRDLKDKATFVALSILANAGPLLPASTKARFARSAGKRDPRRDVFAETSLQKDFPFTYQMVLDSWAHQRQAQKTAMTKLSKQLQGGPLVSIILSGDADALDLLEESLRSVLDQSYQNWEVQCVVRGATKAVDALISGMAADTSKISVLAPEVSAPWFDAKNAAILRARGCFLMLLESGERLDPDALTFFVKEVSQNPELRIIYADHDRITSCGSRYQPHFKPDWNRELFYSANYIAHPVLFERGLVTSAGGYQCGYEPAEDYDLLLRCIETIDDRQIGHIAKVLSSLYAKSASFYDVAGIGHEAMAAGKRALGEHLKRVHGTALDVEDGPLASTYLVQWPLSSEPFVSIIMPARDKVHLTRTAVESILQKTTYDNFEIRIVDNGSVEAETLAWLEEIESRSPKVHVIRDDRPFNYSALNNHAIGACEGEILALANNDIDVVNGHWLREMVSLAVRPDTGCVGAKLYFPDGRIQHAGVRVGFGGVVSHPYALFPPDHCGYFGRLVLRQDLSAVTGACLLVRRSVFDQVGGLNETDLAVAYNDIDFCLKVRAAGYRNIWTPLAELTHHESVSRGKDVTLEKRKRVSGEIKFMKTQWNTEAFLDPAYNINLALEKPDMPCAPPVWRL